MLLRYLNLGYNVLFEGKHGIGKTHIIVECFERAGLKWKYFSASTLDPWVDLVGVPKEVDDETDGGKVLDLIRPSYIKHDEIEAIFFDELNRAPDKVLNAVMELIQFKSINGHKLNNLKVIWGAINPDDDEGTYTVNKLDPAQRDRFHVQIRVPYKVDRDYMSKKYPAFGSIFCDWWEKLPTESKDMVSPRRLDYAADAYMNRGRLEDVLPPQVNLRELRTNLTSLPTAAQLSRIATAEEAEKWLKNPNNVLVMMDLVKAGNKQAVDFFNKFTSDLPKEMIVPFAELVSAKSKGTEIVSSLKEMVEKLPPIGDRGCAAQINNTDLEFLYRNGGSMENDLRALYTQDKQLLMKLSNRCQEVIMKCYAKTLTQVLFGPGAPELPKPTNFYHIIKILGNKFGNDVITDQVKKRINSKLYANKIVPEHHFITTK
jgi:hypothetical protein